MAKVSDSLIRWVGYFFIFQAARITFTEYVVLESMNQELNDECQRLNLLLLQDYKRITKST